MRNPSEDIIEAYDLLYKEGKSANEIKLELQEYATATHTYVKGRSLW